MTPAESIIVQGDARQIPLADESVDLVVTSPPYFALRSYQDGGEHYDGQIGSEASPTEFVAALVECMTEWGRVLKPSGSVFVNLGDKYAGSGGHNNADIGAPEGRAPRRYNQNAGKARAKSLMGLPWRFAIACIDDGWILRSEIVWSKPNGLPESVRDRVRRSHEQWFHFTKEPRYFSGVDEIREQPSGYHRSADIEIPEIPGQRKRAMLHTSNPLGRVPGSVWEIPTQPLTVPDEIRESRDLPNHFAAFPTEWPRRLILGWSPSGICVECGEGRVATTDKTYERAQGGTTGHQRDLSEPDGNDSGRPALNALTQITGYSCACDTPDAPTRPAVVLDPFCGTGTTVGVARALGRTGVGVDMSADYCRLASWRVFESNHFSKIEGQTMAERQMTIGMVS